MEIIVKSPTSVLIDGSDWGRVIGEIVNLVPETAAETIKANIKLAARI